MSVCIEKLSHSCGSSDGLQVFANEDGTVTGYCFPCGAFVRHPYGDEVKADDIELPEPKSEAQIEAEIAEVDTYPVVHVAERKLSATDLDKFDVRVSMSEEDGKTPTAMYFPMTKKGKRVGYYVKTLGKNSITYAIGDVRSCDPFGWSRASSSGLHTLIITEGLCDAVAVEAIYRKHGQDKRFHPAIISLPNGTNSVKSLAPLVGDLARFKKVVLCFDNDEAGHKAVDAAMVIYPKALSVTLPEKDANDCIMSGKMQEAYNCLAFKALPPKNTRILSSVDLHEKARTPTPYGQLTWPFPTMNKLLRGIRLGESVYIGAGVKMGKSELLNALAAHFIKEDKAKVFMAKPEEANIKTYKMMAGKMVGKIFHDPDVEFDYDAYDEAGKLLKDNLLLLNLYQHMGWDTLKQDIVAAAHNGSTVIFIDPITNLTNGIPSSEANVKLQEIAQEASAMALDLGLVIFFFCHLKAPDGNISRDARRKKYEAGEYVGLGNCPHEMGGDILSAQFAGSRAMMRSCNLMLGLEGNKDHELEEGVRNIRYLNILEDREFGNSERIPIWWNKNTTLYTEM